MTTTRTAAQRHVGRLFATLRTHRYPLYAGGLAVVAVASTVAPLWTRSPLVACALTLMGVTYLAELHGQADSIRAETAITAVAVLGIAVGAFVLVEVNSVGGLLFIGGGLLFFRAAVQGGANDGRD